MIEYNPRNWAGAHAPAGNIDAPVVYLEVFRQLSKPIEPTPNDLSDLDLIDGLTRYVMDQAARLRITADNVKVGGSGQGSGQNSGGDQGQGSGSDPCTSIKAQLATANEQTALLQHSLNAVNSSLDSANATLKQIGKVLKSTTIPVRGGGVAWNALRQIDRLIVDRLING